MKEGLKRLWEGFKDFLYPARCPFCDDVLPFGIKGLCYGCRERFDKQRVFIGEKYCMKCGKLLERGSTEYCRDCINTRHSFDRGRSLYIYNDEIRSSIIRYKFGNRPEYAGFYADEMVKGLGDFIKNCKCNIIVPVPISAKKMRKRGYNQAELLSERISLITGIPTDNSIMIRSRDTTPMKELNRAQRMKNLKGVFKVGVIDVKCRNVLIVDDIYTTGSTIDAMASVLKQAGVEKVFFISLASGTPV